MLDIFIAQKAAFETKFPGETLYQCSLGLTMFIDGKVNFKRKSDSMRPMLISIANCHPSDRGKLGAGMSLTMLSNVKGSSQAEQYLINDLFVQELLQLHKGIVFRFEHPSANRKGQFVCVLLQARLLFTHMDTMEYLHFYRCHGSNSSCGCRRCGLNPGHKRSHIKKMVYPGHRRLTPQNHILRKFPHVPTGGRLYSIEEQKQFYEGAGHENDGMRVADSCKRQNILGGTTRYDKPLLPANLTPEALAQIKENRNPHMWSNYDYFVTDFADDLHYPMSDDRQFLPYILITTETMMEDGIAAMGQGGGVDVNGFKGVSPLFRLPYYRFEDTGWDLMHNASNINKHNMDFHKGLKGLTDGQIKLSLALGTHSYLKYSGNHSTARWRISERLQHVIDAVNNTMYVPAGHKDKFNLQYPMRHTKHMRAKDHLVFLTVYAPYLYSFSEMSGSFKKYTERLGSDFSRLLNPCLPLDDLEKLYWSVVETLCIHEGLFPESEHYFIYHEILDIVFNVKQQGHVRGSMCFAGERSLYTIAKNCPVGGVHYLKALFYKYCALENSLSRAAKTPTDYAYFDNDNLYNDFTLKLVGQSYKFALNDYLMNHFLLEVIKFIDAQGIEDINNKSAMRRMYSIFEYNQDAGRAVIGFFEWLQVLYAEYVRPTLALERYGIVERTLMAIDPNCPHQLYEADFPGIIKEIVTFAPLCFSRAVVKGVKFRGRGMEYSENSFHSRNVVVNGSAVESHTTRHLENQADHKWWTSMQYSSWIQVMNDKKFIGQFNGCFRVIAPSDPLIHGLAIANISFHKITADPNRAGCPFVATRGAAGSFCGRRHFACLNDVKSTAFMVSALDSQNLPIFVCETFNSFSWSKSRDNLPISDNPEDLARLYFISMYPERQHFQYQGIERDCDRTKALEAEYK